MFKFKKDRKGFTLIEVLLVLVIIGVLAAIAIPRFMTSKHDAQVRACHNQLSVLRTQVEKYYFDKGVYPASLAALAADTNYFPNSASLICPVIDTAGYTVAGAAYTYGGDDPLVATVGQVKCPYIDETATPPTDHPL